MRTPDVLSVTQLNYYVKSLIEGDPRLKSIYVVGEISNFTDHYRSGHYYMTLKDDGAAVRAAMFRSANRNLRFVPEDGMKVIVRARVTLYEAGGQYQLIIEDMQPDGAGALSIAFEQLKRKLAAEGLFDQALKKPIPVRSLRIGVVTSETGAVIQDIKNVVSRRYPLARIILAPVQVQGAAAASQIAEAIGTFNACSAADVLIVGRGGGSAEDLWAFNEEPVVRAVYDSVIPVISAVGHETDFTLCDFAADVRAPTPSAAAEIAVPDQREELKYIEGCACECELQLRDRLDSEENRLNRIRERLSYISPKNMIEQRMQRVDDLFSSARRNTERILDSRQSELSSVAARLDAMSPLKVIARGYSITRKNGRVVTSVSDVSRGDPLSVRLTDGELKCEVAGVERLSNLPEV